MIYDLLLVTLGACITLMFVLTAPRRDPMPPSRRHFYSDDPTDHS